MYRIIVISFLLLLSGTIRSQNLIGYHSDDIKKIMRELNINAINIIMSKKKGSYEIETLLQISQTKDKQFIERVMQLKNVKELVSESI